MASHCRNEPVLNETSTGPEKYISQHRQLWQPKNHATDQLEIPAIISDVLETYAYQHLDESKNEIRLVTILPGNCDDDLEITLKHVSLNPLPLQLPPTTLSLSQLEETMPPGWTVHETVEGRMLFEGPDRTTTWVHPCPHVKPTAYDITQQQIHEAEDTPDFEALSYTWGSFSRTATVMVYNGLISNVDTKPSILPIGASLSEALRYLRLRDQERVVWIDALCINQDDLEERGHQVGRMAHIYSRARKVVAWLGPDFDDAVKALQGLKYVGEQVEILTSHYFARSPGASEPTWYDTREPVPFDDSFWAAVINLIQRPWFSRYWVIQEIHIGSIRSFLKCGTYEIPWLLFRRAICCLSVKGVDFIARPHAARLNPMCGIVPGTNFEYILSTLGANHYCSDPRDIVYGILSLAPPQLQEALCIDYSADTQLVYKEFFITYTSLQHRSDLLTFAGFQAAETDTTSQPWPSWVPDWRSGIPSLHSIVFSTSSASGQSSSEMVFGAEPHNSMRIKGVLLDATISTLLIDDIADLADVLEKFTKIIGKKIPGETEPESDKEQIKKVYKFIDVMHQGLIADRLVDPPLWVQSREQLRQDLFQNQDFSLVSEESQPSWWFGYKSFVDFWWPGTKLFLTNRGQPGVCKWEVQSGEALFVPLGCLSPIAIRPVGNGGNKFRAVGSVYLDGAMDGEAFLGQLPDQWCAQYNILDASACDKVLYKNLETGTTVKTDPRLDKVPFPHEWEPVAWTRESIDPRNCCRFRSRHTGELINYDPRMTSEALKERGVNIKEIVLI